MPIAPTKSAPRPAKPPVTFVPQNGRVDVYCTVPLKPLAGAAHPVGDGKTSTSEITPAQLNLYLGSQSPAGANHQGGQCGWQQYATTCGHALHPGLPVQPGSLPEPCTRCFLELHSLCWRELYRKMIDYNNPVVRKSIEAVWRCYNVWIVNKLYNVEIITEALKEWETRYPYVDVREATQHGPRTTVVPGFNFRERLLEREERMAKHKADVLAAEVGSPIPSGGQPKPLSKKGHKVQQNFLFADNDQVINDVQPKRKTKAKKTVQSRRKVQPKKTIQPKSKTKAKKTFQRKRKVQPKEKAQPTKKAQPKEVQLEMEDWPDDQTPNESDEKKTNEPEDQTADESEEETNIDPIAYDMSITIKQSRVVLASSTYNPFTETKHWDYIDVNPDRQGSAYTEELTKNLLAALGDALTPQKEAFIWSFRCRHNVHKGMSDVWILYKLHPNNDRLFDSMACTPTLLCSALSTAAMQKGEVDDEDEMLKRLWSAQAVRERALVFMPHQFLASEAIQF